MKRLASVLALAIVAGLSWVAVRTLRARLAYNAAQAQIATDQGSGLALLQRAIRQRPDWAAPQQLLAQQEAFSNPQSALNHAHEALRLDPYDWQSWHTLGLIEYRLDDSSAAWSAFQRGLRVNKGFEAHFQAAALAQVLGRTDAAREEIRQAIATVPPYGQIAYALDAARAYVGGSQDVLASLLPFGDPERMVEAVDYLLKQNDVGAAVLGWARVEHCPRYLTPACGQTSAKATNTLLERGFSDAAGESAVVGSAFRLWNAAIAAGWLSQSPASWEHNSDPNFQHPWIGQGFAWNANGAVLHQVVSTDAGNAARFQFDGTEPEQVLLLQQWVLVRPGVRYDVEGRAKHPGSGSSEGLRLQVNSAQATLLQMPLRMAAQWTTTGSSFVAPLDVGVVQLQLWYRRPNGQTLLHSPVWVTGLGVRAATATQP